MISLARSFQVCEYGCNVFINFNDKLSDKIITSAVERVGKVLQKLRLSWSHAQIFNINHACSWSRLLSKVLGACNQCQESIDFCRNGSNWVWNKLVCSCRIPKIVPRILSPKLRKYLEEEFSTQKNQRHLLRKRQKRFLCLSLET